MCSADLRSQIQDRVLDRLSGELRTQVFLLQRSVMMLDVSPGNISDRCRSVWAGLSCVLVWPNWSTDSDQLTSPCPTMQSGSEVFHRFTAEISWRF